MSFVLHAKDPIQIGAFGAHEGAAFLSGRDRELAVELGHVFTAQELVGSLQIVNPTQPQLLRQAPLPSAGTALHSSACLWRIGRDHPDSQLLQRPAHLPWPGYRAAWARGTPAVQSSLVRHQCSLADQVSLPPAPATEAQRMQSNFPGCRKGVITGGEKLAERLHRHAFVLITELWPEINEEINIGVAR